MEKDRVLNQFYRVSHHLKHHRLKDEVKEDCVSKMNLSHFSRNLLGKLYKGKQINQRTLATRLDISSQAVSKIVEKLENNGCIYKVTGKQNNENFLELTDLGKEVAKELDDRIKKHANYVFESFSDEEIEVFSRLLEKMNSR